MCDESLDWSKVSKRGERKEGWLMKVRDGGKGVSP